MPNRIPGILLTLAFLLCVTLASLIVDLLHSRQDSNADPHENRLQSTQNPFTPSDFALIQAGSFLMGSADSLAYPDEQPVHMVTLTQSFYLGKTEVTQAQWTAIMDDNPSHFKGDSLPVDNIGPPDIQMFLERLNKIAECESCYRLPTEAEWEYAAKAGSDSPLLPDSLSFYAWFSENSAYTTHPVAQKKPNAWGVYDMQGNVYEWVQDVYGPYPNEPVTDPDGATDGNSFVLRGGSWTDAEREVRVTYRDYYAPNHKHNFFGFRLVKTHESFL